MRFNRSIARALAVLCAGMLLQSCAGFVIHDEARSKVASDTKQSYTDAKITDVPKVDAKNLEIMLTAELEVLREASRIELDFALLALANNTTPMGYTFSDALGRLKVLGIPSLAQLRQVGIRLATIAGDVRKLHTVRQLLEGEKNGWGIKAPECNDGIPATVPFSNDATTGQLQKDFLKDYEEYRELCLGITQKANLNLGGKIGAAFLEWQLAQAALDESVGKRKAEEAKVKAAKKAYDDTVAARAEAAKTGKDLTAEIVDKAKKLAAAVEVAKKVDKGVENDAFIDSLVDLLTATAGGDVNPQDPALQGAVAVAKQIPSLAGDIADLEAKRTAPPVSGLLIALRHQTLLAENAKKRAALAAERVAILKTKYDLYLKAADRWQLYFDATCNYAVSGAGKLRPGTACDKFDVTKVTLKSVAKVKGKDGKMKEHLDEKQSVECRLDSFLLDDCLLTETWKKQLRGHQTEPVLKRQLYESVAAYLQAVTLQARPLEQSMREIDVRHRETLLAKQTAIEQWDNLVGVPLDQLEAYYKAGVKPAELADLIVKALGFTAIAIGVSK